MSEVYESIKGLAGIGSVVAGMVLVDMSLNGGVSTLVGVAGAGAVLSGADSLYWGYKGVTDMM